MLKFSISKESDTAQYVSTPFTSSTESFTSSEPSPRLRSVSKPEFFFSTLVAAPSNNSRQTPIEEIEQYCRERVILSHDFDVLKWWGVNENRYPLLSKVALKFLTIPASSAPAERVFSLAGNVITEKRNRLGPTSVDNLLFLHSYYKHMNKSE
uniref:Transposable element Hobo transposase n=1 Tax=Zeugodacus cucurbitae TaxID=28588 RepID=A0A0A1WDS8_ZEUCU